MAVNQKTLNEADVKIEDNTINSVNQNMLNVNKNIDDLEDKSILNNAEYKEIVKVNNLLIKKTVDFSQNEENAEVVKNYLIKTFEGLNHNPYKKIIGDTGRGWFGLYLLMKTCEDREAINILQIGLMNLHNIQTETGLLTLNFNLDWVFENDPSLGIFTKRVFEVGNIISTSKIDKVLEKSIDTVVDRSADMVNNFVKEIQGNVNQSFWGSFWDGFKWVSLGVGIGALGYLGYKAIESFSKDQDIVIVDINDFDQEHPSFV